MKLDATRIYPKLYVGSVPPAQLREHGFDAVVLCAAENQDVHPNIPAIRVPFDDSKLSSEDYWNAVHAAQQVSKLRKAGKRVLVTCHMGINRSAFVAALSLMQHERLPANIAIERVRSARQPVIERHLAGTRLAELRVLGNPSFVDALRYYEKKRG